LPLEVSGSDAVKIWRDKSASLRVADVKKNPVVSISCRNLAVVFWILLL